MEISVRAALRQFSRTIFADRLTGDEIMLAVEAEIRRAGNTLSDNPADAFRAVVSQWRTVINADQKPKPFSNAALIAASGPLPSEGRLAVILSDIIGFSPVDVDTILGPLSRPVTDILAEERQAISNVAGGRALIIEDEPLLAADLADLLESMGVTVVGIARAAARGVELALEHKPDIVLADFNLVGEATGLDAVEKIQDAMTCSAIFITGFPEKVLTGDRVEPDFVIAKPYTTQAVRTAVAQSLLIDRIEQSVEVAD